MKRFLPLVIAALWLVMGSRAAAVLANAWHIPDNAGDLSGTNMRSPEFEIGPATAITVYSGVQKFNNSYGTANQTGGWVIYKGATQSSWSSNALSFYLNGGPSTNNQYWKASFTSASFGTNEVIQYYLGLTFDGVNGVITTYLYGSDGGSSTTASPGVAAASPFTVRNRPAWLYHAGNRVVTSGTNLSLCNASLWIKTGYIGKDSTPASQWADNACIYYTTNGSTPAGTLGTASGATSVVPMAFDHVEDDSSIAGNGMWWVGSVSNLPTFTTINYKIGVWNSSNSEEKFADYGSGTANTVFSFSEGNIGDPVLTVNDLNANYTTTHVFVDEVAGDSIPLTLLFSPNTASNVVEADIFSNLNRRERATQDANGDGIEDGVVPPDGNTIATGDDNNYYKAYAMSPSGQPGQFSLTLNAQKTGAYRLTARYKISGNTNWIWYSTNGRRDHCVVVSPTKARNVNLYELNAMNIDAQGTGQNDRSTFTDLYNGPGSRPYDAVTNRFNLAYAQNLGVNWLWFQPIHPIGIDGRETDPNSNQPYAVGSPYSVKNFFQVNPLLSKANTRDAAMTEFSNFVAAADAAGVNVMLDAPFNHSAWDCELDASGIFYFAPTNNPGNWQTTDEIRNDEARFYSRTDAYDMRASSAANIALAPDRYDFGKWPDVHDIYFGRYAALVANASQSGNQDNEGDWFDYSTGSEDGEGDGNGHFDRITQNVWRYFADYALYWLDKTGCPAGTPANQTAKGIDGLRADFGQGLPPQCWEYIINKVRSRKWDFVFMTESLDGGAVTYRSNRQFDILNENIVFPLQSAATASDYRNIFDDRRNAYGQSLVLLNNTSHDEQNYADPFQALVRYSVCSTIDGAPMIFYGQELGISTSFGFNRYEQNFGKTITLFKDFNSLQPIFANRLNGVDFLWPVYAAINQARQFSPALRSSNRYYLDQTGGGPSTYIFSVAKYETANASPNVHDIVFAFANLDRYNQRTNSFNVNITQNGANLFGIKPGRIYNVKNISAYTGFDLNRRNYWQWGSGIAGSNVLAFGVFVSLNPVPGSDADWNSAPFEAQYLKLYDVTPPVAPSAPSTPKPYALGTNVTFSWPPVVDPDGGISGYHVLIGTFPGGSNVFNGMIAGTSVTVTNSFGQTLYAQVSAINNISIEGAASAASAGTVLIDPASVVLSVAPAGGGIDLAWPGILVTNFTAVYTTTNLSPPVSWQPVSGLSSLLNQQWKLTLPATNTFRFYRLQLN